MLSLKKDKKEEEDKDGGNPYANLEKTSVLQEARWENEWIVKVRGDIMMLLLGACICIQGPCKKFKDVDVS